MTTEQLSPLEQYALEGILQLDCTRERRPLDMWGKHVGTFEYINNPGKVYAAAMEVLDSPNVVRAVAHYLLNADDSHKCKSERLVHAVSLLQEVGDPEGNITRRVIEAVRGETPFHTVQRYHSRLGNKHNRDGVRGLMEEKEGIYTAVMTQLAVKVITPQLVLKAIDGFRGKDKEHAYGENLFKILYNVNDRVQKIREFIGKRDDKEREYLGLDEPDDGLEEGTRKTRNMIEAYDFEIASVSGLIHDMLTEFFHALGQTEFERCGFSLHMLDEFGEEARHIRENVDKNIQKLSREAEKEERPWYRKLLVRRWRPR